jgi:hypothetical protein
VSGVGYQPVGQISGVWNSNAAVIEMLKAGLLCNDNQTWRMHYINELQCVIKHTTR